jgi:4-hydroxy-tetrahydrodipicolinate reductase
MRIGLIGSSGRMGQAVQQVVKESGHQITAKFDINDALSRDGIKTCDVLIDFSTAAALQANLDTALTAGIPFVTGTTGWYDQKESLKEKVIKADGSFLYASNFSVGILLFHKLLARAAQLYGVFEQYDFAIHEIHHNQKADSPSGTALTLAEAVIKNLDNKTDRQLGNPDGKIAQNKLHVSSSRVGNVPGTHTLYIESQLDSVDITHRAHGRIGFASGALKAAEWLIGKKGFYSMEDMINTILK